mgnify:CR=1 FL=1
MAQATDSSLDLAVVRQWRALNLGWVAGTVTVLVLSRLLTPNPTGWGTHTEILPLPCVWHVLTGLPCPGCGLTTAFAWMARGDGAAAWRCNPLGPPAYVLTWVLLVWSLVAAGLGAKGPSHFLASPRILAGVFSVYLGLGLFRMGAVLLNC